MTKAYGYVRRSTDRQEESLEQQRQQLEAFAERHGWQIVGLYQDDAISGSDMKRPGLRRMIHDAETNDEVEIVLAWDRNRLARPKDPVDGMLLERKLADAGKKVVYAATGLTTERTFTSDLIGFVEHHQNGDYLRKLSRDTMRGTVDRARKGQWPGGPIPFGFDRLILGEGGKPLRIIRDIGDGSQAILDPISRDEIERLPKDRKYKKQEHEICTLIPSEPERVRAVQRLFKDYAAGVPTRQLREALNDAGFRTSRGNMFSIPTLNPMFENQAYIGSCVYNRRTLSKWHTYADGQSVERKQEGIEKRPEEDWIVAEDAWEALIDRDLFEQVQQRRKASKDKHQKVMGQVVHSTFLLTGLFRCGVCGGSMTGASRRAAGGVKNRRYVCSTNHNGHKDRCPKRYEVPADPIERHVLDTIVDDLRHLAEDDRLHELIREQINEALGGRQDASSELQKRLAELDQQAAKLRDHLLALDPAAAKSLGLYEQAESLASKRAEIERKLAQLTEYLPNLPDAGFIREKAQKALSNLRDVLANGTIEQKRELIAVYVQKIKADPDTKSVMISLYPALFRPLIAGTGFEPVTSGL
ncbi:recombinase family protein [Mucisphaera sp.]|uniref:recombinase family protein n=1 Tax=Mucisphaera sp. TaxID=2913024 RepID=UPI003D10CAB5